MLGLYECVVGRAEEGGRKWLGTVQLMNWGSKSKMAWFARCGGRMGTVRDG